MYRSLSVRAPASLWASVATTPVSNSAAYDSFSNLSQSFSGSGRSSRGPLSNLRALMISALLADAAPRPRDCQDPAFFFLPRVAGSPARLLPSVGRSPRKGPAPNASSSLVVPRSSVGGRCRGFSFGRTAGCTRASSSSCATSPLRRSCSNLFSSSSSSARVSMSAGASAPASMPDRQNQNSSESSPGFV